MPESLNALYETFLQAAQVINQQNALRQRAEQEEARLTQKEQALNDLNQARNEKLKLQEDMLGLQKEKEARIAADRDQEIALRERAVANQEARAKVSAAKAGADPYTVALKQRKLELGVVNEEVDLLEKQLDAKLQGKRTGLKHIDDDTYGQGLMRMDKEGLKREFIRIESSLSSAMRNPLGSMMEDISAHENTNLRKITDYMNWRTNERQSLLEESLRSNPANKAAQVLMGTNYLMDAATPQPGQGEITKKQDDQAKANAGGSTQSKPTGGEAPPSPGTVGGPPPSPEIEDVFKTIDSYSTEALGTPQGLTTAASYVVEKVLAAHARGDVQGRGQISTKVKSKSPALDMKVKELLQARRKPK